MKSSASACAIARGGLRKAQQTQQGTKKTRSNPPGGSRPGPRRRRGRQRLRRARERPRSRLESTRRWPRARASRSRRRARFTRRGCARPPERDARIAPPRALNDESQPRVAGVPTPSRRSRPRRADARAPPSSSSVLDPRARRALARRARLPAARARRRAPPARVVRRDARRARGGRREPVPRRRRARGRRRGRGHRRARPPRPRRRVPRVQRGEGRRLGRGGRRRPAAHVQDDGCEKLSKESHHRGRAAEEEQQAEAPETEEPVSERVGSNRERRKTEARDGDERAPRRPGRDASRTERRRSTPTSEVCFFRRDDPKKKCTVPVRARVRFPKPSVAPSSNERARTSVFAVEHHSFASITRRSGRSPVLRALAIRIPQSLERRRFVRDASGGFYAPRPDARRV